MLTVSALSTEYVQIRVSATVNGVSGYNPTADSVQMAFLASGNPTSGDWHTGLWETISSSGGQIFLAQCLVGPGSGGVPLAANTYNVWLKVTDNPEVPVRNVGLLQIV
jgi:hypothetical protein